MINLFGYMGRLRIANLLEEEKCYEPSNDRETCRHSAREKVRILLQELVVTEQVGEPFGRT